MYLPLATCNMLNAVQLKDCFLTGLAETNFMFYWYTLGLM